jgi:hypothetical protein
MPLLLKIAVIWISIDVVILASVWLAARVIQALCPTWWERNLVGKDRDFTKYHRPPITREKLK